MLQRHHIDLATFAYDFRLEPIHRQSEGCVAIYRTLYYGDVKIGVGGRVTIPQEMREDLRLDERDLLTVRIEETPTGIRQMVLWRAERSEGED